MVLRCARSEAVDRGCSRAWCTASGSKVRCFDAVTAPPPHPSVEHRLPGALLDRCSVAAQVIGVSPDDTGDFR
jgi:hypothetical protein